MSCVDTKAVIQSPEFKSLLKARARLSLTIAGTIIVTYFGFILLVAFAPSLLGKTLNGSVISIGIYTGLFLLILSFVLTATYIWLSEKTIAKTQKQIQDQYN